jgi:hypothetical protein
VVEHRAQHFDELAIGVGMRLQLRADRGQAGGQLPVLERRAIAQSLAEGAQGSLVQSTMEGRLEGCEPKPAGNASQHFVNASCHRRSAVQGS